MTISVDERQEALKRALVLLAELCGDFKSVRFGEQDLKPASPLRTTLSELKDAGLITQIAMLGTSQSPYMLTLNGWFEAQRVSGRFDSDEFNERRGRLCAAMKKAVAGRHQREILDWRALAKLAELPPDWVWNVLDAQVLNRLDSRDRYYVRFERGNVWIETTFGQEPVSL
jgi:hypothetical protein